MKYKVEVQELLARTIEIEACDKEEAIAIIKGRYDKEEIVLDSSDFCGAEIKILE